MRKLSKNLIGVIALLAVLVAILAGAYMFMRWRYQSHFFSGTKINGIEVGGMTVDDTKYAIQNRIRDYTLTCSERGGKTETITGSQIYMQYVDDGTVEKLMKAQNANLWIFSFLMDKNHTAKIGYDFDESSIDNVLNEMDCFQTANIVKPEAAHIDTDGTKYYLTDAEEGNTLNKTKTKAAVIKAIKTGKLKLDFEKEDLYEKPAAGTDDAALQSQADTLNKMLNTNIVYDMVDRQYVVDSTVVKSMIEKDGNGNYALNQSAVAAWVAKMAYETDTYGMSHQFTTNTGKTITLAAGGDYGWCIDQTETTQKLVDGITQGVQEKRDPDYVFEGKDRSTNDIGKTYIEICIEKQEMWCYQNGQLVVDTPVVTGNHAAGQDTPSGSVYAIDAKMYDTKFQYNGNVHVWYWLPFIDGCGVHDASWRSASEYGGTTWLTNGSNGCINTPKDAASKIYDVMNIGDPVIVYYSEDQVVGTQPTATVGYTG